uniref:C2H2-type domain-containing protein n=1 Tax=Syphacia muris TaxID=451379 RepID=A0A0N5AUH8_9BILA
MYDRNRCNDCEYRTNSDEQATFHQVSTGHVISRVLDSYIESISSQILADCYKATFNIEASVSDQSVEKLSIPIIIRQLPLHNDKVESVSFDCHSPSTSNQPIHFSMDRQQDKHFNGKCISSLSSVLLMPPKNASLNEKEVSSAGVIGISKEVPSHLCEPVNNISETPSASMDPSSISSKRRRQKGIDEAYLIRRVHVLENHCSDKSDPDILEVLEAEMRSCFPTSTANNDNQCNLCGKEFRGKTRRSHVLEKHFRHLYPCVIPPCTVSYRDFGYLKEHVAVRHGKHYLMNKKENVVIWNKLEHMRRDFITSLQRLMAICFPYHHSTKMKNNVVNSAVIGSSNIDDVKALPKVSACDKVADILKDVIGTKIAKSHAVENIEISSSDSDSDVRLIDECGQESGDVEEAATTSFKKKNSCSDCCTSVKNHENVISASNSQFMNESATPQVARSCNSFSQNLLKADNRINASEINIQNTSSLDTSSIQTKSDFSSENH